MATTSVPLPGTILRGSLLPEPLEVFAVTRLGANFRIAGRGLNSGQALTPVLTEKQLLSLTHDLATPTLDGDASLFRLGVEAHRLGLAYEYDPYFSLSIARVDPLPHQLEAVYEYFLKLPRIRFLLADDPGAGKTIMAGLLLKELKARGLVKRALIVTPANLTFQWQRELKDKFREQFEVINSDVLRTNYGQNPWQDRNQLITSVSWVSRVEDARESLLRSRWDLVIVDEAHKMAAYAEDRKTLAYRLGEALSGMTDHLLLMTATPHKGDPENFCLFLSLLDKDVYGNVESLEQAMRQNDAPFYLRRIKEALVTFPDPETGNVKRLFTKRKVNTADFQLDGEELDFYDALTRYVEDQSILASAEDSARGRAVGFTMAMLQRRMASTVYAVRRSLERMKERREKILSDPDAHRKEQIERKLPDDFEDLTEEEQQDIVAQLEDVVADVDPAALRDEIAKLAKLVEQAKHLERRQIESKLTKLKSILTENGFFSDPKKKLLVFTEHKDSLDFLAGDGRDGRPLGKLREWGLTVTTIHGGMKIGDRDTPGSRIYAEREFRETCQILVATEAAGEGINLQFCSEMVNYDIPWNPVRLEQRIGRIHRYGQEKTCVIFNFVATNTREGRVLGKLQSRLAEIRKELGTDQVFDVVGEVLPANEVEKLFRDMYARRLDVNQVEERIVDKVDPAAFRAITQSALEGLAKKELNLSAVIGRSAEAKERRLVPEVIENFFIESGPVVGLSPKPTAEGAHTYRIGRTPRQFHQVGDRLESRFGKLGREYAKVCFDKQYLVKEPTLEWVTPGHPLFEVVRETVSETAVDALRRGAIFYSLKHKTEISLDVFAASIKDGRGNTLHRRLFVVETLPSGEMILRQPTIFLDVTPASQSSSSSKPTTQPAITITPPDKQVVESFLVTEALTPWLEETQAQRAKEIETVAKHVEISLWALLNKENLNLAELLERQQNGQTIQGIEGRIAMSEQHLDELNNRLETRRRELDMERHATIADISHIGRAVVVPHPERHAPDLAPMVRDDEVEKRAIEVAIGFEEARGWVVEDVQKDNRGFDLISRRPHPEDPKTFIEVRFIEVKGRAGVGEVFLSANEYRAAERLKTDYWLYAVFNCAAQPPKPPELNMVHDPARLGWEAVVRVEQYRVNPVEIRSRSVTP
jgi:superfamily II DNA or RNA helicase